MRKKVLYTMLFALFIITLNCKNNKSQSPTTKSVDTTLNNSKLSIRQIGELLFRRSYSTGLPEPPTDRELEKMMNARPTLRGIFDEDLKAKIEPYGFVKEDELLLEKFKYDTASIITLNNASGTVIKAVLNYGYTAGVPDFTITISNPSQASVLKVGYLSSFEGVKYKLLDIVPGGYPEIILLNEHYIMNGDNFDLLIFEIDE